LFEAKITSGEILNDIIIFEPSVNNDRRGNIFTSYQKDIYNKFLPKDLDFIHDKFSSSKQNVLRGLHGDTKTWKLISCVYGDIYEVVVDLRPKSSTYMKWESFNLNNQNNKQILVPPHFLNGYYVLSENATFHYKLAYEGEYFDVGQQTVVRWNDKGLNIDWPCTDPILQDRDK